MSNPFKPLLDASLEFSRITVAIPSAMAYGRGQQEALARASLEELIRFRDRVLALGLPPIQEQNARDRQAWEWDITRALTDLVDASRQLFQIAAASPLAPQLDKDNLTRFQEEVMAQCAAVNNCLAARARQQAAWDRVWSLAGRVDMSLLTRSAEPPPEKPSQTSETLSDPLSPEEILAQADAVEEQNSVEAQRNKDKWDGEENLRQAAVALTRAVENLYSNSNAWQDRKQAFVSADFLVQIATRLREFCHVFKHTEDVTQWSLVDHESTLAQYVGTANLKESRVAYTWARHLIDQGLSDGVQDADISRAWDKPALRNAFKWLAILCRGLARMQSMGFRGPDVATDVPTALSVAPIHDLFRFDLVAIFRCAVELAIAVAVPDGAVSREAETAGERLQRVLNPRDASFPTDPDWELFKLRHEVGDEWNGREKPRPGWADELDLADASSAARQALMTIGLALADLRGDPETHRQGLDLLSSGIWNLWEGLLASDRNVVRSLLADTHRLWGWPADPAKEPGPFDGRVATLSDRRCLSPCWRSGTAGHPDVVQERLRAGNYFVDHINLANGGRFAFYRYDCRPTTASLPSICPKANPKPPIELRPDDDMLADIEARYRALHLITDQESIHWVGRQTTPATTCTCDLTTLRDAPRPAAWSTLRQLRQAIVQLIALVHQWTDRQVTPATLGQLDRLGERVAGLTQAIPHFEMPCFPSLPLDQSFRLRGPASVPVLALADGIVLIADAKNTRLWEAYWRAIRVAVDARLAEVDAQALASATARGLGHNPESVALATPPAHVEGVPALTKPDNTGVGAADQQSDRVAAEGQPPAKQIPPASAEIPASEPVSDPENLPAIPGVLELIPGGFRHRGRSSDLSGKAWEVLRELIQAREHRATARRLLATIWKDKPDADAQSAKDAINEARSKLRESVQMLSTKQKRKGKAIVRDPIPYVDKGPNLAWKLDLQAI